MKLSALVLVIASISSAALAQRRPDTTDMACGQARSLVARSGAIVLGTGGSTYDRFVLHRGFCTPSETVDPAFVPTRDSGACMIGYRCREMENEFDD